MPRLQLWRGVGVKTNDYKFIDRLIAEQYVMGGTEFYIHKMLGIEPQDTTDPLTVNLDQSGNADPVLSIQDVLNMENRDRSYDPDVYSLMGHYRVSDTEFDLRQFGLFLSNNTLFITFHLNNMVDQLGRKLMSGDVIEVVHQRDDLVLGSAAAISKFYVVQEGTRPAEGYSYTWWPHLWRVKCDPITDSQEYRDILALPATDASGDPIPNPDGSGDDLTLQDVLSTQSAALAITDAITEEARRQVPFRYFQSQHFYIIPGANPNILEPNIMPPNMDIWVGDGIPPNESEPVPHGNSWPTTPLIGDYFLRTDYNPPQLYRKEEHKWKKIQTAWRNPWLPANQTMASFINNDKQTTLTDGTVINEQQNIQDVIAPKKDPNLTRQYQKDKERLEPDSM
jgi:hypothetical protein